MIIIDKETIVEGLRKGLTTTWELGKVIVPTAMVITFLEASGGLKIMAEYFAPFMSYLGLPGEAAIVLFSGYFLNLYAAIGSIMALGLGVQEITVLALMLGFCHSLVIELAVSKKAGAPVSYILPLRLGLSLLSGLLVGGLLL